MDIGDQIGGKFVKVENVLKPYRAVIAYVRPGSFDRPEAQFQDGKILSLNATNLRTLAQAWGTETDDWIGSEVEVYVGKTEFNKELKDSVLLRPVSERKPRRQIIRDPKDKFPDDEIPF